jgi:large subunit ribosomal protein L17
MRKRKSGRKLNRKRDQRKALLKTLAGSLILKEKIRTTEAKAKEISRFVEKRISRAKVGSLYSRRLLRKLFPNKVIKKLIDEIAPRFKERKGGYTRIIRLGSRKSDGAKVVIIELLK